MAEESWYWFVFYGKELLLLAREGTRGELPRGHKPPVPLLRASHALGRHEGVPCVAFALDRRPEGEAFLWVTLPKAWGIIGKALYDLAGRGYQMIHWDAHSRFCPVCGARTARNTEVSKRCPACGHEIFPPIAVAILALVRKKGTVLLARAHNFEGAFFGLVAGFLEPGETLEACVSREVMEETGIAVSNIRYFGCQAWPYPSGLMVGFIADYAQGELALARDELAAAGFFTRDELPSLPHRFSLARQMIDWWIDGADELPRPLNDPATGAP